MKPANDRKLQCSQTRVSKSQFPVPPSIPSLTSTKNNRMVKLHICPHILTFSSVTIAPPPPGVTLLITRLMHQRASPSLSTLLQSLTDRAAESSCCLHYPSNVTDGSSRTDHHNSRGSHHFSGLKYPKQHLIFCPCTKLQKQRDLFDTKNHSNFTLCGYCTTSIEHLLYQNTDTSQNIA